ncbi:MAG: serine protease [bacterium]|nr:serine protease [bacterium]
MNRFISYVAAAAAVTIFLSAMVVVDMVSVRQYQPIGIPIASSTLSVTSGFFWPTINLPNLETATNVPVASSSQTSEPAALKKVMPPVKRGIPVPVPVVAPVTALTQPVPRPAIEQNTELNVAASTLRDALVNIICYVPAGSGLHSISGSGIIIDPKGIILTNAHIAQYFLLKDRGVSCTIRTGSPAADRYTAALMYIPTTWLQANSRVLTQTNPSGTGEYDFALLAIIKSATTSALPSSFPSIPLATAPPPSGTPIIIASYGAQFLESSQVQFSLFPTIVFGSVKDVFTFASTTIDVLALGGSAAAQEGSSGGGVADASGELVGTITTSTTNGTTDTRKLDAITASYIRWEYASETGQTLDSLLAQPVAVSIADFALQLPTLESIITTQLP